MCGIAGLWSRGFEGVRPALARMSASMASRGPDDTGEFLEPPVGLIHRRLAIIDTSSAAAQPMSNEDGTIWLVANSEIYNFASIREQLRRRGHRFRSQSDSEVILHSYEENGDGCVSDFDGMVAFALWDVRSAKLLLARDRLGIKPLYYYVAPNLFLFASQVRALLATGLAAKEVDLQAVNGFLTYGHVPRPLCIVKGVQQVPPGHLVSVVNGAPSLKQYWTLPLPTKGTYTKESREQVMDHVRGLLVEAVSERLVSDVPLGTFLSGGIDSSAVTALAAKASPEPLSTFTVCFDDAEYDESQKASTLARQYQTRHTELRLTADAVAAEMPKVIAAMDQPTVDGVNTYFVSKLTKEAGITVALSGVGGDELFCGYLPFHFLPRLFQLVQLWNHMPKGPRRVASKCLAALSLSERWSKYSETFRPQDTTLADLCVAARTLFSRASRRRLLAGSSSDTSGETEPLAHPALARLNNSKSSVDVLTALSFWNLSGYTTDQLLRDTDCMSMTHALEVRVPLLDHQLLEHVLRVPPRLKLEKGTTKALLARSLHGVLPDSFLYRTKRKFLFPFPKWLRHELKPFLDEMSSFEATRRAGLLHPGAVSTLKRAYEHGKEHWSRIWACAVLNAWCIEHLA